MTAAASLTACSASGVDTSEIDNNGTSLNLGAATQQPTAEAEPPTIGNDLSVMLSGDQTEFTTPLVNETIANTNQTNNEVEQSIEAASSFNPAAGCDASLAVMRDTLLPLFNQVRSSARQCGNTSHEAVPALVWDDRLRVAAARHSNDMATNDFFSHTGSDNSSVSIRVNAVNFNWRAVGENIAAGQMSAEEVVQGWTDSPGHCQNIMNADFVATGVACSTSSSALGTYWTNVFATEF